MALKSLAEGICSLVDISPQVSPILPQFPPTSGGQNPTSVQSTLENLPSVKEADTPPPQQPTNQSSSTEQPTPQLADQPTEQQTEQPTPDPTQELSTSNEPGDTGYVLIALVAVGLLSGAAAGIAIIKRKRTKPQ